MPNFTGRQRQYSARLDDQTLIVPLMQRANVSSGVVSFDTIGIAAPASAPSAASNGAGVLDGDYIYYYTYFDSSTNTESNASAGDAYTASSNECRVTFGDTPASRVTHRRLYRKSPNSSFSFFVAQIAKATTTYDDDNADSALIANDTLSARNGTPAATFNIIHRHGARLFAAEGSNLYYCEASKPEQWDPLAVEPFASKDGYDITALASLGGDLIVFKERGVYILRYKQDPSAVFGDGASTQIVADRGALNQRTVVSAGNVLFVMDGDGVYVMTSASQIIDVSAKIRPWLERRNLEQSSLFSGVATANAVRWFCALDGETECQHAMAIDRVSFQAGSGVRFWPEYYQHKIRDACQLTLGSEAGKDGMGDRQVAAVIDKEGSIFLLEQLLADGVPVDVTVEGTLTEAASGSSGTTVCTDSAASVKPFNAHGGVVRNYARFKVDGVWSAPYWIEGNAATTFTLTGEVDIADGTEYVIGQIEATYDTPSITYGDALRVKQLGQFSMAFTPSPSSFDCHLKYRTDHHGFLIMDYAHDDGGYADTQYSSEHLVRMGGHQDTEGGRGVAKIDGASTTAYKMQFRFYLDGAREAFELSGYAAMAGWADEG